MLISDIVLGDVPRWARAVAGLYNRAVSRALSEPSYVRALEAAGLKAVRVLDRQEYGRESISNMIRSELDLQAPGVKARLGRLVERPLVEIAANRVTSIRVYARRA